MKGDAKRERRKERERERDFADFALKKDLSAFLSNKHAKIYKASPREIFTQFS